MAATKASGRLSDADRLRKGILELVDTETSYIQDLIDLRDHYLEPLQLEEFFTHLELDAVLSVIHELISFHQEFLTTLQQGITLAPDFQTLQSPADFKRVLFSLGGSFFFFSERFRLYSAYCASHARTQTRLRTASEDPAITAALRRLNPDGQHASSLSSLLIKPIQRVLKYPLLLHSLVSPTHPDSEEHYHMAEAQRAMQQVAGQINDAQRLFEEFGEVFSGKKNSFNKLSAKQPAEEEAVDLSMGDLLLDETVCWLDPPAPLARAVSALRRGLKARVFVFKTAVVLIHKEAAAMASLRAKKSESNVIKFKHLIPTHQLEVHMDHSPDGERSAVWELRHVAREGNPVTTFTLQCSDPSRRSACVSTIRSLLRAALRSRLLNRDTSSSSSISSPSSLSQQYQPFGGDRLSALRARYRRQGGNEPSRRRLGKNGNICSISSNIDDNSDVEDSCSQPPEPTDPQRSAENNTGECRNVKRRVGASRRQQVLLNARVGAVGGVEDHGRGLNGGDGGDGGSHMGDGGKRDQRADSFGDHRDYEEGTGVTREQRYDASCDGKIDRDREFHPGHGGDDDYDDGGMGGAPRDDRERGGTDRVRRGHGGFVREPGGGDVRGDVRTRDGGGRSSVGSDSAVGYRVVGKIRVGNRDGGGAVEGVHARGCVSPADLKRDSAGCVAERGDGRGLVRGCGTIDISTAAGERGDHPTAAADVGEGLHLVESLAQRRSRTLDDRRSQYSHSEHHHHNVTHNGNLHRHQDQASLDTALVEASLLLQRLQARNLERQRRRGTSTSSVVSSPCSSPFPSSLPSLSAGGSSPSSPGPGGSTTPQLALARLGGGARVVHDSRTQAIAFGADRRAGPLTRGPTGLLGPASPLRAARFR